MNYDPTQKHKLEDIYSNLDEIIRESEALIAEFMKINCEVEKKAYSLFRFFRKKRTSEIYGKFHRVDEKLMEMGHTLERFCINHIDKLPASTQAYVRAYEKYLNSVETATELRVDFEKQLSEFDIWKSKKEDMTSIGKLKSMIGPSLAICEMNAHHVNAMARELSPKQTGDPPDRDEGLL